MLILSKRLRKYLPLFYWCFPFFFVFSSLTPLPSCSAAATLRVLQRRWDPTPRPKMVLVRLGRYWQCRRWCHRWCHVQEDHKLIHNRDRHMLYLPARDLEDLGSSNDTIAGHLKAGVIFFKTICIFRDKVSHFHPSIKNGEFRVNMAFFEQWK